MPAGAADHFGGPDSVASAELRQQSSRILPTRHSAAACYADIDIMAINSQQPSRSQSVASDANDANQIYASVPSELKEVLRVTVDTRQPPMVTDSMVTDITMNSIASIASVASSVATCGLPLPPLPSALLQHASPGGGGSGGGGHSTNASRALSLDLGPQYVPDSQLQPGPSSVTAGGTSTSNSSVNPASSTAPSTPLGIVSPQTKAPTPVSAAVELHMRSISKSNSFNIDPSILMAQEDTAARANPSAYAMPAATPKPNWAQVAARKPATAAAPTKLMVLQVSSSRSKEAVRSARYITQPSPQPQASTATASNSSYAPLTGAYSPLTGSKSNVGAPSSSASAFSGLSGNKRSLQPGDSALGSTQQPLGSSFKHVKSDYAPLSDALSPAPSIRSTSPALSNSSHNDSVGAYLPHHKLSAPGHNEKRDSPLVAGMSPKRSLASRSSGLLQIPIGAAAANGLDGELPVKFGFDEADSASSSQLNCNVPATATSERERPTFDTSERNERLVATGYYRKSVSIESPKGTWASRRYTPGEQQQPLSENSPTPTPTRAAHFDLSSAIDADSRDATPPSTPPPTPPPKQRSVSASASISIGVQFCKRVETSEKEVQVDLCWHPELVDRSTSIPKTWNLLAPSILVANDTGILYVQ